jgi:hypothetical protein
VGVIAADPLRLDPTGFSPVPLVLEGVTLTLNNF